MSGLGRSFLLCELLWLLFSRCARVLALRGRIAEKGNGLAWKTKNKRQSLLALQDRIVENEMAWLGKQKTNGRGCWRRGEGLLSPIVGDPPQLTAVALLACVLVLVGLRFGVASFSFSHCCWLRIVICFCHACCGPLLPRLVASEFHQSAEFHWSMIFAVAFLQLLSPWMLRDRRKA